MPEYYNDVILANTIALRKALSSVLTLLQSNHADSIHNSLSIIKDFFSVDRVFIGFFTGEAKLMSFIQEVHTEETGKMPEMFYNRLSKNELPWWLEKIKEDRPICVYDSSVLPAEAEAERKLMEELHIGSQLAIPTYYDKNINGFVGMDCVNRKREWSDLDIENLRLFSGLFSFVIEQIRSKEELRKSSFEALKSEAKFQLIFEKMPMGIEVYDKEGLLLDINPADMDIFGITKEKALGTNMFENPNIPQEAKEKARRGEEADMTMIYRFDVAQEKGFYQWEEKRTTKYINAKCTPLKDGEGELQGYLFLVTDVTENHLKNEQIQSNLAKLQIAVDTGNAFLWEFDLESGSLRVDFGIDDNPDYLEQIDAFNNSEGGLKNPFIDSIHPDDYEKVAIDGFQRLIEGEIDSFTTIFRRIHKGEILWYNCNIRTYKYNAEGKPARIVCYMVNVTEQQEKEMELLQVKEADRLKAAFLANMSHEIRTPLNAIVGFSNILGEMYDNPETGELVQHINKNNEVLLQLVSDLLDFSYLETKELPYTKQVFDLKELCKDIYKEKSHVIPSDVELIFPSDAPPLLIHSDRGHVKQVIYNLLNNAFKFTEKGSVRMQYEVTGDNRLRFEVVDTGIGIAEEHIEKVFHNFYKVDNFEQGVGLGLSISKNIMEDLGGSIGIESQEKKGSVAWFTLPLS
ncbi:ATP-binding protein [Parabacteroides sp. PFB2-10]|uniref:sensor histidine kinase n=1 Tax=Parabacteroides sp. PFB2-10 TaxID=1742405 RepID=UPI0024757146|nr:ATP-binding protein [Parabacteroides sp. PFB2-10]